MLLNAYAVRDLKMQTFGPIFLAPNDEILKRTMGDVIKSGRNKEFVAHPEDYVVYRIGQYDEDKGIMVPSDHLHIMRVDDVPLASQV